MSSVIKTFIDIVDQEWSNDQLYEMANVTSRRHGIENVVIWVGATNKQHGLRIKVSNIPNKMDMNNNFTIMMSSLDYDHTHVANWITSKIIDKIITWIKLNQQLLYDYELGLITDTDDFLNNIIKV